jgi:group I intron endonuclease
MLQGAISMNIYSIYRATNTINGKVYIGFTSQSVDTRINQHKKDYNRCNWVFYYAIRKYGWEVFQWETLYQSTDGEYTKNVMEAFFIRENNSYIGSEDNNGYNMSMGGDGNIGYRHSEATIKSIGDSNRGKPCPEWQKAHLSKLLTGRPHAPGRKSTAKTYSVESPTGENLIVTNITKFCRDNNLHATAMCQVAKGTANQHKGWTCKLVSGDDF